MRPRFFLSICFLVTSRYDIYFDICFDNQPTNRERGTRPLTCTVSSSVICVGCVSAQLAPSSRSVPRPPGITRLHYSPPKPKIIMIRNEKERKPRTPKYLKYIHPSLPVLLPPFFFFFHSPLASSCLLFSRQVITDGQGPMSNLGNTSIRLDATVQG